MTTRAWSYPISQASDAEFRGWGSDLAASLAAVGLVKTSDTGQINWTTVTRAAANNYAGYEIWRYPDSTIFMKWEYGSANNISSPAVRVSVGTGSNGSGTLTGTVSAANPIHSSDSGVNLPGTSRTSLMCLKDGFFGFCGYLSGSAGNVAFMFFAVSRTTDANGVPTSDGASVFWGNVVNGSAPPTVQALNFTSNTTLSNSTVTGFIPGNITSSLVGSDNQVFLHWVAYPRVYPVMPIVAIVSSEFVTNTTFTSTVLGTTPRTYVVLDNVLYGAVAGTTTYKLAMLWE